MTKMKRPYTFKSEETRRIASEKAQRINRSADVAVLKERLVLANQVRKQMVKMRESEGRTQVLVAGEWKKVE